MKILVCIKQVPDTEANPEIRGDSLWIKEENIAFRMNRYDEYALEEALLIKDAQPGTVIDIITVGPERASAVLKKALEKGADNAVHLRCSLYPVSANETASLISEYASGKSYDIILAGVMSEDAMQCVVGPMIASLLSIPCAVSVVKFSIDHDKNHITAESELEGGIIETVNLSTPCLLTVQTGVNQPRYPSLSNVMKARGMAPVVIDAACEQVEELTGITVLSYPESNIKGVQITGSTEEKAEKLIDLLHERGIL